MSQEFSPIQNHILTRLKNAKSLRYSEIMPEKIANDLYNYHLQFLVKKGFVLKQDDGYSLSESWIKHVADPHLEDDATKIASLFKVNVITIVSRVVEGEIEILNQIRKSHPSYGKVGVMGGIVRKGELTVDAASRKLKAETGLEANFRVLGVERRLMYVKDKLFSDVLFPIVYSDNCRGKLLADTEFGHNMWVSIDEAIKNDSGEFDSIWNIVPVLKAIRDGEIKDFPYFYDEVIQSGEEMVL